MTIWMMFSIVLATNPPPLTQTQGQTEAALQSTCKTIPTAGEHSARLEACNLALKAPGLSVQLRAELLAGKSLALGALGRSDERP